MSLSAYVENHAGVIKHQLLIHAIPCLQRTGHTERRHGLLNSTRGSGNPFIMGEYCICILVCIWTYCNVITLYVNMPVQCQNLWCLMNISRKKKLILILFYVRGHWQRRYIEKDAFILLLQSFFFYVHGSVHRESNLITVQQDATYSVYYISVGSSTCSGCWHPSSGARTTVITASGIDEPNLLPSALVVEF